MSAFAHFMQSIEAFSKGGREEMAENERYELTIIESFLPSLADEATTRRCHSEIGNLFA